MYKMVSSNEVVLNGNTVKFGAIEVGWFNWNAKQFSITFCIRIRYALQRGWMNV